MVTDAVNETDAMCLPLVAVEVFNDFKIVDSRISESKQGQRKQWICGLRLICGVFEEL